MAQLTSPHARPIPRRKTKSPIYSPNLESRPTSHSHSVHGVVVSLVVAKASKGLHPGPVSAVKRRGDSPGLCVLRTCCLTRAAQARLDGSSTLSVRKQCFFLGWDEEVWEVEAFLGG
jgi:hypothetical protein